MVSNPAGFWIRLGAGLLDGIIIGIPLAIITLILGLEEPMTSIFQGGVNLVYGLLLPVLWLGYTIGKKICGVRIVKMDGENVGIGTMLLRTIVAGFVYLITFGIAVIVSAFMVGLREDKRSLHDLIAGTYVTYDAPGQTPEAE